MRESINSHEVRKANAKSVGVEEGGDVYKIDIRENAGGDVEFIRYDSNGNFMDGTTKNKLVKAWGNLSDEELAAKSVYGTGKIIPTEPKVPASLDNTINRINDRQLNKVVDDVPTGKARVTNNEAPLVRPDNVDPVTGEIIDTPLGTMSKTFYDNNPNEIRFKDKQRLADNVMRQADLSVS